MSDTIYVEGDFEYEQSKFKSLETEVIDASKATWIVSNFGDELNRYPVIVEDGVPGLIVKGGEIFGEVPLDISWRDAYENSAAVLVRDTEDVVIENWKITQAWDAIRVTGDMTNQFTIDSVWLSQIRDDGIENDDGLSGTISNSLFDGVFVGVSMADSKTTDQTDQVVTLDNVLIRMESYLYKGEITHGSLFKVVEGVSPSLNLHNNVFAIEDVNHAGQGRLEIAWDSVLESSNNYFLNLSGEPFPDDYPLPPSGFTILEGQEAWDFWNASKEQWLNEHGQVVEEEVPVEEPEEEPNEPEVPVEEPEEEPNEPEVPVEEPEEEPNETEVPVEEPEEEPNEPEVPVEEPEEPAEEPVEEPEEESSKPNKASNGFKKFFEDLFGWFAKLTGRSSRDDAQAQEEEPIETSADSSEMLFNVVPFTEYLEEVKTENSPDEEEDIDEALF